MAYVILEEITPFAELSQHLTSFPSRPGADYDEDLQPCFPIKNPVHFRLGFVLSEPAFDGGCYVQKP